MTEHQFEFIKYEVDQGRARITLNRPEKRNALSIEMVEELRNALWEADDDKSVHCVILRGAGNSFCAGYDLTPSRKKRNDGIDRRRGIGFDDDAWHIERFQRCLRTLTDMHKPSIAQIHGHCYAGGTDLAALAAHNYVYFGRHEEGTLESPFAGNLVEVCPTGVFTDRNR